MAKTQRISGDLELLGIFYAGDADESSGTTRTIHLRGTEANIGLVITTKGTGTIHVPSGYEANISSDQDLINRAYANSKVGGIDADALVTGPGAGQDGYVLTYDHGTTSYTLAVAASALSFENGLTQSGGTVKLGGDVADATTNITLIDTGVMRFRSAFATGADEAGLEAEAVAEDNNQVRMYAVGGQVRITPTQMFITAPGVGAMQYVADYSANFSARSIPDLEWVSGHIGGNAVDGNITGPTGGEDGYFIAWDDASSTYMLIPAPNPSTGYFIIEEDGTPITQRQTLNFVGIGATVADAGGKTVVTLNDIYLKKGGTTALTSNVIIDLAGFDFTFTEKVKFTVTATESGLNLGSGDPSAPATGDIWYSTSLNVINAYIHGTTRALMSTDNISGAGRIPYASGTDAVYIAEAGFEYNQASNTLTVGNIILSSVANTQIAFGSAAGLTGDTHFTWNSINDALTIGGTGALTIHSGFAGSFGIYIGNNTGNFTATNWNIGIGRNVLTHVTGSGNIVGGDGAAEDIVGSNNNIVFGNSALANAVTVSGDIVIGPSAGLNVSTGSNDIIIGTLCATNLTTASKGIFIGYNIDAQSVSADGQLVIQNAIFGINNTATGTSLGAGSIGIYVTNPTARLHIRAGSTTYAPLKIDTGTALITPEDGAIEYHGTHLWFTTGGVRYQLDQQGGAFWNITGTTDIFDSVDINYTGSGAFQAYRMNFVGSSKSARFKYDYSTSAFSLYSYQNTNFTGYNTGFDIQPESFAITSTYGSFQGITYSADFSADYISRSIPDWGNVWRVFGTTTLTGAAIIDGNNVTFTGGTVRIEGPGNTGFTDAFFVTDSDGDPIFSISDDENLVIGQGGSYTLGPQGCVFICLADVATSTTPTNGLFIYAADSVDATTSLALRLEQAVEAIGVFTASHKLKIKINGTWYWVQLDAV